MNNRLIGMSFAALCLVAGASAWSWAQLGPTDNRFITYQGALELDGVAVSGSYDIRFALFAVNASDNSCLVTDTCTALYKQTISGVGVSGGRFAVELGPIPDTALHGANDFYIANAVRPSGGGAFVALLGRQHLTPAPFAARAVTAKDYRITGDLSVDGNATFTGGARQMLNLAGAGIGTQPGTEYFRAPTNFAFYKGGSHAPNALDPGAAGVVQMSLDTNGNASIRGTTTTTGLTVNGGTTLNANSTVNGNLAVSGTLAGRVVGGGEAVCATNGTSVHDCRNLWGNAVSCGACGVNCSRGTAHLTSQFYYCWTGDGHNFDHSCVSAICVE